MSQKLNIRILKNGPYEENCYLVGLEGTDEGFLIDPGSSPELLLAEVKRSGVKPVLILATHAHFDHVGAVQAMKNAFGICFACHPEDRGHLDALEDAYAFNGFGTTRQPAVDRELKDGETVRAGGLELKVIHTPGHSAGSLCFYHHESATLFSGDTLFRLSVGRSDFPGGSQEDLLRSIREKLFTLPPRTVVYPGHGQPTTVAEEIAGNPFVQS